ncbi:unnamed protein product [Camellia sinensis]
MAKRDVAIIGGGISGLLACKYTLSKGYLPTSSKNRAPSVVFGPKHSKPLNSRLPNLSTNSPTFHGHPQSHKSFPINTKCSNTSSPTLAILICSNTSDSTQEWSVFAMKALRMRRWKHGLFGVGLVSPLDPEENGTLQSTTPKAKAKAKAKAFPLRVYQVDFVILSVGRFSGVPNIPEFPPGKDPQVFQGQVLHSMDYASMDHPQAKELVQGKRVAVVGLQKSALDIAMECSTANGVDHPCTVIYRTEHWNLPDYEPWGIHIAYLYLTRLSELSIHKPSEGLLLSLLATLLSPLRWAFSKFVETHIQHKLHLAQFDMVPKHSFLQELSTCLISSVPEDFYNRVEKGSIRLKKASSFGFCKGGILVDGETEAAETDMVILATGFKGVEKLKDIFVSPNFQECVAGSTDKTVPLYRLAIIGFSESVANLYTSEIRCRWLAELLDGTFKLPSIKEMEKDIVEWDKYMKQYSDKYYRRSCIGALHIWYNDQLCKDMGWNPKRKKGFIAELFEPYGPTDYAQP